MGRRKPASVLGEEVLGRENSGAEILRCMCSLTGRWGDSKETGMQEHGE